MIQAKKDRKRTGQFAAYTAARFLIGAALCLVLLSLFYIQSVDTVRQGEVAL